MVGFVSGPAFTSLLSDDRKGSTYSGMLHSSDWYKTLVEGIAGGTVPTVPGSTGCVHVRLQRLRRIADRIIAAHLAGPTDPDGFNLWTALVTGGESPRHEVVHQVQNQ